MFLPTPLGSIAGALKFCFFLKLWDMISVFEFTFISSSYDSWSSVLSINPMFRDFGFFLKTILLWFSFIL